jgi:hypothetical protein
MRIYHPSFSLSLLLAQERQLELDVQTWMELDRARARKLVFVNECIEGIERILKDKAVPKIVESSKKYNARFDQMITTPEGQQIQPFLRLISLDTISTRQNCFLELERLGHERNLLDPVTMCLTNMPQGALAYKAAASAAVSSMSVAPLVSSSSPSSSSTAPSAPEYHGDSKVV